MDTSDNVGNAGSQRQLFPDSDLQGRKAPYTDKFSYFLSFASIDPRSPRFTALVEAISKGDKAIEDSILRCWGVRR